MCPTLQVGTARGGEALGRTIRCRFGEHWDGPRLPSPCSVLHIQPFPARLGTDRLVSCAGGWGMGDLGSSMSPLGLVHAGLCDLRARWLSLRDARAEAEMVICISKEVISRRRSWLSSETSERLRTAGELPLQRNIFIFTGEIKGPSPVV